MSKREAIAENKISKDDNRILRKVIKDINKDIDKDSGLPTDKEVFKSYIAEFKLANSCLYSLIDNLFNDIFIGSNSYNKEQLDKFSYIAKATLDRCSDTVSDLERFVDEY